MKTTRRKKHPDLNELAKAIVSEATEEEKPEPEDKRNPAAVALGRLGGLKGGKARAEKLTPEQRADIARVASIARWKKAKKKKLNGFSLTIRLDSFNFC